MNIQSLDKGRNAQGGNYKPGRRVLNLKLYACEEGTESETDVTPEPHVLPRQAQGGTKHFAHNHPLYVFKLKERDSISCRICERHVQGEAYGCSNCMFYLHVSCFRIPRQIKHRSHPAHSLTLLSSSAYKSGRYYCDACGGVGDAFHYNCSECIYDLHLACAVLPRYVYHKDHQYPLNLYYTFPLNRSATSTIKCNVCDRTFTQKWWVYCNRDTNYISHLCCALGNQRTTLEIPEGLQNLKITD